ncbi:MAG: glucosyl-3-phosphoglycerate synthase [Chloroflexi bacterium]|nr:glucosyl-3-phosphoglycerate synthase [Chloroflexota bacterium]
MIEPHDYKILVPLADPRAGTDLIQVAAALMPVQPGGRKGRVVALGVVEIPEELGFTEGAIPARLHRQGLGRLVKLYQSPDVELRTLVRVSRHVWQGIVEAAREEQADLILFGWKGWTDSSHAIFGATIDEVVRKAPCDIAIAKQVSLGQRGGVLLPVRGGPHAVLALQLATGLAERLDCHVTAMHIQRPACSAEAWARDREEFDAILSTALRPERVRPLEVAADEVEAAILAQAASHGVVVMGAAAGTPDTPLLFGPIAEAVAQKLDRVVVVKTRIPGDMGHQEWEKLVLPFQPGAPRHLSISTVVDKWFAENTFDSQEFEHIDELVRLKQRQGLTVSLALPALNEEETVGQVIRVLKTELVERYPLVDELVLIDSDSTDRTREIASALDIPVHIHQQVLPEYRSYAGKGEALWKSLYVTRGDIVVWVDTDIRNMHPRFVYGLLGPLFKEPRIKYVKGFYKRPIRLGGTLRATGGGRVTELTARPLLNLFFPELSGIIQPLSGEYAGRREVLERLPFFTGYGVEVGLLVDMLEHFGLSAIGQVDLKRRVHRNQSLVSLSKMAFTITLVAMRRLEQRHRLQLLQEVNTSMKLIQHGQRHFHVEVKELEDVERPPIITLPEYRSRLQSADLRVQI